MDVGSESLIRADEELAELASLAEHDVAQHDDRPKVTGHLDGGVDLAS